MRRRTLLVALAGLAVTVPVAAWLLWPGQDEITPENYERIKAGMSRAEVEAILGGPPGDYRTVQTVTECFVVDELASRAESDQVFRPDGKQMWFGNKGYICISFESGFVADGTHPYRTAR